MNEITCLCPRGSKATREKHYSPACEFDLNQSYQYKHIQHDNKRWPVIVSCVAETFKVASDERAEFVAFALFAFYTPIWLCKQFSVRA